MPMSDKLIMKLCKLDLWLETTHVWHSLNLIKNSSTLEPNLVISVHTRLKIKCSFLVNRYALRVSNLSKLLLTIRYVSVVVTDKLYCSTLIRISVNLLCKHNFMEVFKVYIQAWTEFKCLLQQVKDSFIESE